MLELSKIFLIPVSAIGHIPFIRAPKNTAAEMVAKKLDTKIRDAILSASRVHGGSSTGLFASDTTGLSNLQRPREFLFLLPFTSDPLTLPQSYSFSTET